MSPVEKKCYFGFDMAKSVNFKLSGDDFNLKNNGAIVIPQFSTICGQVCNSFGDICETFAVVSYLPVFCPVNLLQ